MVHAICLDENITKTSKSENCKLSVESENHTDGTMICKRRKSKKYIKKRCYIISLKHSYFLILLMVSVLVLWYDKIEQEL